MKLPEGIPNRNKGVLDQILASVQAGLPARRLGRATMERAAASRPPPPSFRSALNGPSVALIAEVKRRSPSAGDINEGLNPVDLARDYELGGAAAISVLTEATHFGGTLTDLELVTAAVELPVLRKDFVVEEIQLLEARAVGAAAVLLIVRILDQPTLEGLIRSASDIGLDTLVEVHDRQELDRALAAGALIVGVNARNLDSFEIDVDRALRLLANVPADRLAVAESGMRQQRDIMAAAEAGADAVLVGGALASAPAPRTLARQLSGVTRRGR